MEAEYTHELSLVYDGLTGKLADGKELCMTETEMEFRNAALRCGRLAL